MLSLQGIWRSWLICFSIFDHYRKSLRKQFTAGSIFQSFNWSWIICDFTLLAIFVRGFKVTVWSLNLICTVVKGRSDWLALAYILSRWSSTGAASTLCVLTTLLSSWTSLLKGTANYTDTPADMRDTTTVTFLLLRLLNIDYRYCTCATWKRSYAFVMFPIGNTN